jgi:hypothetical protein
MTPVDLQQALRAVEPAAVLVAPRLLENIIRQTGNLSGFIWQVPHRLSTVVDRQTLFLHVEQEELALGPEQLLPAKVILLAWPEPEDLHAANSGALLLQYWQRLFHGAVHLALENRCAEGRLSAAVIRSRLDQLGPAQVEEIKNVLVQDHYLAADPDERSLYLEFAAVYLELHSFAAELVPICFPGLRDRDAVLKLLGQDVDGKSLYRQTRPPGAPEPVTPTTGSAAEAHEYYWRLIESSERAAQQGNMVRAAIQRRKAARVAPAALAYDTRQQAAAELASLLERLQKALALTPAEAEEWRRHLPTLLDKADQGGRAVEAALLFDLQKVCIAHEREIYTLNLADWLLSAGRRPIQRALPSERMVRVARTLRTAAQRLTLARLSDHDRNHLAKLLQRAVQRSEEQVRNRLRPLLTVALQDVGLSPRHPLEATAFRKVVEELLDRVIKSGFVTFSELRDTLSRNQLKLPDLTDPQDFIRGDPLLRLDRRLATLLDGVYRPSEFYLRWLERFTALNFGTAPGRLLTLYVTVPFLGAFLLLEAITMGLHRLGVPSLPGLAYYPIWALMGFSIVALMHSARFREKSARLAAAVGRPFYNVFIGAPLWIIRHTSLERVTESWPFQLFYWYLLKPAVLAGFVWVFLPLPYQTSTSAVLLFLSAELLVNSRPGQAVGDALARAVVHSLNLLRAGLIPALFRFIVRLFKQILHLGEAVLFTADVWLRFRGGDSRSARLMRGLLSFLWSPVSYLLRFHMVVLIEPGLNPLKLPFSSLATKFMLPLVPILQPALADAFSPLGSVAARVLAWWIIFWLPDVFGFMTWEMKENWSLYRSNRRRYLGPVPMGPHGETLRALLLPGFHSGTIPKLFARLRRAERRARRSGSWTGVRACQSALAEVEHCVALFVAREFCTLLEETPDGKDQRLEVQRVELATNLIRVQLLHTGFPDQALELEFENWRGSIVAAPLPPSLEPAPDRSPGAVQRANLVAASVDDGEPFASPASPWLERLPAEQRTTFHNALATLYKLAGVDLLREAMPAFHAPGLAEADLHLRINGQPAPAALEHTSPAAETAAEDQRLATSLSPLHNRLLVFRKTPLSWDECARSWQTEPVRAGSFLSATAEPEPGPSVRRIVKN